MGEWLRETAGTIAAALLWMVGTAVVFIAMGVSTHLVVDATITATSGSWRAVAGTVAAMLLVLCGFFMVLILGKGATIIPARWRRRRRRSQL
jgi:hypothetical protein